MAAPKLFDFVKETTNTTGAGTLTLAGAMVGFRAFVDVLSNDETCYYAIKSGNDKEAGIGTFTTAGTTLARTTILASTNAGAAISVVAGAEVFISFPASLATAVLTPRVGTTASSATPTPNADTDDVYTVTALAVGATFGAPTGTPISGQPLIIRVKDNGTARTLAFNAIYSAIGITLPTTTVISKTLYLGCIYNAADTKWDVIGYQVEA